jgi:hypothetical protein
MSGATPAVRRHRVRHDVRDGLAVMAFSATASVVLAALLLVLTRLAAGS